MGWEGVGSHEPSQNIFGLLTDALFKASAFGMQKTADITDRENLLFVISALHLNVELNLMTLSLWGEYHYTENGGILEVF